jgi:hypothetical protein
MPEHIREITFAVDGEVRYEFKADLILQELTAFPELVYDPDIV